MPIELTAEEKVTRLLVSKEMLNAKVENFYITSPSNLGDYLNSLPEEKIDSTLNKNEKYTFIKEGKWKF